MPACQNVINASAVGLFIDGTLVAYTNDISITLTHDLRETTSKDSAGWRDFMEGLRSWESGVAGWYASDDTTIDTVAKDSVIDNRQMVAVQIKAHSATPADVTASGGNMPHTWAGNAWIENVGVNANGSGTNADFTFSLRGCGPLTYNA